MVDSTNQYQKAWESFWGTLTGKPEEVLWNVPHELAVAPDFDRFKDLIAANHLPLVDVGCGDGTQTRFFASHVARTIGVDVSAKAIEIGRSTINSPNLEYQVLDILNKEDCQAFHAKTGDVNIYMRGVLMQFLPADRPRAVENLINLIGEKGYLYLNEYVPQMKTYYAAIIEEQGMPAGFARVLKHGITAGGISQEEIEAFFPANKFERVRQGTHVINTIIPLKDGSFARAPAFYLIIRIRA
jgi:SAM-dependent methyltransferase